MRYLLDSHVFLWLVSGSRPIHEDVRAAIQAEATPLFLSTAGIAELCIKNGSGKLMLPAEIEADAIAGFALVLEENSISPLPVTLAHAAALRDLPMHHRDPFDRLIIAQAMIEGLTLVTHDRTFARYEGLAVLWT